MKPINMLFIIAITIAIIILPFFLHSPVPDGEEAFSGADTQAEKVITKIKPDYKVWFTPLFEPPSGEIETLIFTLQAIIGALFIGFYFGRITANKIKTAS